MNISNNLFSVLLVLIGLLGNLSAHAADDSFQPIRGQPGKDVIWIPTPPALVTAMLSMAKVTPSDVVYDLGAGDGIIAITAAKQFGARSFGIEYDEKMAQFARRNAQQAGVADKVKIIHGDIFVENFSQASVVTLYLLPSLNLKLRPIILQMKPGTRVVAHAFDMGDWEPDQTAQAAGANAFMWTVPAYVEGEWEVKGMPGVASARLSLRQSFQRIGGNLHLAGYSQPLLGARIEGGQLSFQFMGPNNSLQSVTVTVNGAAMSGSVKANYDANSIEAKRL